MTTATSVSIEERIQLLESFELAIDAAGLSPATLRLYGFGIRKLYAFLEGIGLDAPLSSISAEHLREFLRSERQAGAAPATLDALHRAMRRFWKFLAEEGEVTENVALRVPAPKLDVKIVEALTSKHFPLSAVAHEWEAERHASSYGLFDWPGKRALRLVHAYTFRHTFAMGLLEAGMQEVANPAPLSAHPV